LVVEGRSRGDLEQLGQAELVGLVLELLVRVDDLTAANATLRAELVELTASNAKLAGENERFRARLGQSSGNSSLPSSRDTAAERARQAEERKAKRVAATSRTGGPRKAGKQKGAKGFGPKMVATPDVTVEHRPDRCGGCGAGLGPGGGEVVERRQVIDLPEPRPVTTEHQRVVATCGCGTVTSGRFPADVRSPVSYSARVRAVVVYLLARQHIPVARVQETMRDLYGLDVSAGTVDNMYRQAGTKLKGFIAALAALLRTLAVLHCDETTDRVGTATVWMHVVSTSAYTLIHASWTRGYDAVIEMGVLNRYRGVIIHDRLALYWKFKRARHGICGAHLLRDLEEVAVVATQKPWAGGLAGLLVAITRACDDARIAGHARLAPGLVREFTARYDRLVADGLTINPDPPVGVKRSYHSNKAFNLATAFAVHKQPILRFMNDLDTPFTNNQAERDLRPGKIHRKVSGCFRSIEGAQRHAHVRSYLSTTRKHDIPAITALTDLFNDRPWMPPATHPA